MTSSRTSKIIDLNTDFGQTGDEGFFSGKQPTLLTYVSSVNIPCCVHDGDPAQVLKAINVARLAGVAVGAHIGFPDPQNLGYKPMDLPEDELEAWILLQLGAFTAFCKPNMIEFGHVRPHGAMYSAFINDEKTALAVSRAIKKFDPWLIQVLPVGELADKVESEVKVQVAQELYLGKRMTPTGNLLLERFNENLNPQAVMEQVKQVLTDSTVTSEDGKIVKVKVKTLHISPKLRGNMLIAERIKSMVDNPVALPLETAGSSGWL